MACAIGKTKSRSGHYCEPGSFSFEESREEVSIVEGRAEGRVVSHPRRVLSPTPPFRGNPRPGYDEPFDSLSQASFGATNGKGEAKKALEIPGVMFLMHERIRNTGAAMKISDKSGLHPHFLPNGILLCHTRRPRDTKTK